MSNHRPVPYKTMWHIVNSILPKVYKVSAPLAQNSEEKSGTQQGVVEEECRSHSSMHSPQHWDQQGGYDFCSSDKLPNSNSYGQDQQCVQHNMEPQVTESTVLQLPLACNTEAKFPTPYSSNRSCTRSCLRDCLGTLFLSCDRFAQLRFITIWLQHKKCDSATTRTSKKLTLCSCLEGDGSTFGKDPGV